MGEPFPTFGGGGTFGTLHVYSRPQGLQAVAPSLHHCSHEINITLGSYGLGNLWDNGHYSYDWGEGGVIWGHSGWAF